MEGEEESRCSARALGSRWGLLIAVRRPRLGGAFCKCADKPLPTAKRDAYAQVLYSSTVARAGWRREKRGERAFPSRRAFARSPSVDASVQPSSCVTVKARMSGWTCLCPPDLVQPRVTSDELLHPGAKKRSVLSVNRTRVSADKFRVVVTTMRCLNHWTKRTIGFVDRRKSATMPSNAESQRSSHTTGFRCLSGPWDTRVAQSDRQLLIWMHEHRPSA